MKFTYHHYFVIGTTVIIIGVVNFIIDIYHVQQIIINTSNSKNRTIRNNNKNASISTTNRIVVVDSGGIIQDHVLCGGCFLAKLAGNNKTTCGLLIKDIITNDLMKLNFSTLMSPSHAILVLRTTNFVLYKQLMQQAAINVSLHYPNQCRRCNPSFCKHNSPIQQLLPTTNNENQRSIIITNSTKQQTTSRSAIQGDNFYRYDAVFASVIQRGWTHYLSSIPSVNRFPVSGFNNIDEFVSNTSNIYPNRKYYFEYNPSIVLLPNDQRHRINHPITGIPTEAVYFASFRVTDLWLCIDFHSLHEKIKNISVHEWAENFDTKVAYALLDRDLNILTESVFDGGEDTRIFNLLNYRGDPQLFITRGISQRPVWVIEPTPDQIGPHQEAVPLHSIWPSTATLQTIYIGFKKNVLTATGGRYSGKNFVYFNSDDDLNHDWKSNNSNNNKQQQTRKEIVYRYINDNNASTFYYSIKATTPVAYMSNYPPNDIDGIHRVSIIEINKPRRWKRKYETDGEIISQYNNSATNLTAEHRDYTNTDLPVSSLIPQPIIPSFYTIEEVLYAQHLLVNDPPWRISRGNACCIDMIDPTTKRKVLVGISHSATVSDVIWTSNLQPDIFDWIKNGHKSYLSQFYAFEPVPPFRPVAVSGRFCLPYSSIDDFGDNPYHGLGERMKYPIPDTNNQSSSLDCPRITFVMSMTYKFNDRESILISYGVNDCVPRIIEMKTVDLYRMLFYGVS